MTRRLTPETTITTAEAAALIGVVPATIRKWAERRKLAPAARGEPGYTNTYHYGMVLAAERSTRQLGLSKRLRFRRHTYGG